MVRPGRSCSTWRMPRPEVQVAPCTAPHFSVHAQRKVSKRKRAPSCGSARCAGGLPSLHRRSGGQRTRAIHGSLSRGGLILSRHPCRSLPYTTIPLGLLQGAFGVACYSVHREKQSKAKHASLLPGNADPVPLQEAERRHCAGGREAWTPSEERRGRDAPS